MKLLEELIELCGEDFYHLEHVTNKGKESESLGLYDFWRAEGDPQDSNSFLGKGNTPREAVESMLKVIKMHHEP